MNSSEINKIMASVLLAGITFMVAGIIGSVLVHPHRLDKPAIRIEVAPPPGAAPAPAAPVLEPIAPLMAAANAENGARIARQQCGACHNFVQGGPNGVGPNLYAILGAPHAHSAGFNYSPAIAGMKDKPWTYEDLNAFLANPRGYAPGTRMGYAGMASASNRADVIAYLRSLDANPKPLPEVTAAPAAPATPPPGAPAAAAPAAGGIAARLASADVAAGEARAKVLCMACHTFNQGGRAGVGPNLWNVVGGPHAHMEGFNYSPGIAAMKDKPWTYEELDRWLANPMTYSPGTRMPLPTPDPQVRANIIAWLRTLSDNPKPLPEVTAAPAAPAAPPPGAPTATPAAAGGIAARLASADVAAGEARAKVLCVACHTFNQGGRAGVGPNLWNVVGGPHAHMEGFNYSPGIAAMKDKPWTYEELDRWLANPMTYSPGTRMPLPTPDPQVRANIIAWLRTLSDNPKPLP